MADESIAAPPVKSGAKNRLAVLILVLILGFVGYGIFERTRLVAAVENEKKAVQAIRDLKGAAIEATVQDWRVVFVPDQPQMAQRVGGVYVPNEGTGPGYNEKIADLLRTFDHCKEIIISAGPVSGAMRMGPVPKRVLKPGEIPPEPLDIAAIRKEFPRLKVSGEEYLIPKDDEVPKESPAEAVDAPKKDEPAKEKSDPAPEKEPEKETGKKEP